MLLAEEILVLATAPSGGLVCVEAGTATTRDGLVRALLAELSVRGAIHWDHGFLRVIDPMPLSHRLLTVALRAFGDDRLTPDAAAARLRRRLWVLRSDLMDGLERNGITHRLGTGLFGRLRKPKFALQSTQTRASSIAKLKRGCLTPRLDELDALALAMLCDASGLATQFVSSEQCQQMRIWVATMKPSPTALAGGITSPRQRLAALAAVMPNG